MKATKNQANAVRSYLATLGIEIGHVQALEVIARGAGLRSRHAPAATTAEPHGTNVDDPVRDAFGELLALRVTYREPGSALNTADAVQQVQSLLPCLFSSADDIEEFLEDSETGSVTTECEAMCRAGALRQAYVQSGRTPSAQATALKALVRQCGEFFTKYEDAYLFLTQFDETEHLLQTPKGESPEASDEMAELSERIRAAYHDSGCQRSDLEEAVQRLVTECADIFEGEESAVAFLHVEQSMPTLPEMIDVSDEMSKAEEIKAEYDRSRCHADDVDHAVRRLMAECPNLYGDDRTAWSFINEELHEELDGRDYIVQVQSDIFGNEVFPYYTEEERRAGVIRLMAKAVELNDGVTRRYYFTEIDSDIEKDSPEYDQALTAKELEGEIVDNVVSYQGNLIGTIAEITDGDLTLYSWIDDNP